MYSSNVHRINPPCPEDRIAAVEQQLGPMPEDLRAMLMLFNGGQLFIKASALASVFGLAKLPAEPHPISGGEWCIEEFTSKFRSSGSERQEWEICMKSYGVLTLLDTTGATRQWDTARGEWSGKRVSFNDWLDDLVQEGDAYLAET
jgi:hypothetical protein